MEDQWRPLSDYACYNQEEGFEELQHSLLCTSLELETTILSAKDEITKRENQLICLKNLLNTTTKERDEAKAKCHELLMENLMLQQKQQVKEERFQYEESKVDDCEIGCLLQSLEMEAQKLLPEKGKLLQAVMEAGPLLQNLLVAGSLPQWQHPPPKLESIAIPSITVPSPNLLPLIHQEIGKKRDLVICEDSDASPLSKFQKL